MRPYAATGRKHNVSLASLIHSGSLWRVSLFGSLNFTVCKNRYTRSLIIPQYSVGSNAVKKAKLDGSLFNFLSKNPGILPVLPTNESLSMFLIEIIIAVKELVLRCRIVTFWSNLALNIVSTVCNDL